MKREGGRGGNHATTCRYSNFKVLYAMGAYRRENDVYVADEIFIEYQKKQSFEYQGQKKIAFAGEMMPPSDMLVLVELLPFILSSFSKSLCNKC